MNAIEFLELYKQRSFTETWIEQVKIAGSTLTDDFRTNNIFRQLSVLAYNILVIMRQEKTRLSNRNTATLLIGSLQYLQK